MKKKIVIYILFVIFGTSDYFSQQIKYPSHALKADLQFMINTMEETHIDLYSYHSKSLFNDDLDAILNTLTDSLTRIEFWKLVAPLISKLGDGHTSLYFPEDVFMNYLGTGGTIFPFSINIQDDNIYIDENYSNNPLISAGSRIISTNNYEAKYLLDSMKQFVSGEKMSFINSTISNRFFVLLWLLFDMGSEFYIEYIPPKNTNIMEASLLGITGLDYEAQAKKMAMVVNPFELMFLENDSVALIDFKAFKEPDRFEDFLKSSFRMIKEKGIKNLIIDIRNNGGGNSSIGDQFFNYLTDKPYRQFMRVDVKSNGEIKFYENELTVPEKREYKFQGNIYLLTGSSTFSSANSFSSAFKCFEMGTIVGEETGGVAICYGDVKTFKMPTTNLMFGVSFKKFWEACATKEGRGVIPDHEVRQLPEDSASGIDTILKYTLKLIKSNPVQ